MFKNSSKLILFIFLLLTFAFAGCKSAVNTSPAIGQREVTDDLGRKVGLPLKIERAVSLAPSLTENIFAVGAGDRLIGVTTYCNYPAEAQKIAKIGDTLNPNLESIIALKPQVVFISTASQMQAFMERLEQQNIAVFVTNPQDIEGVYRSLYQIGEVMGETERAKSIVEELQKRVTDVETRTANAAKPKVFLQISREPFFTIGKSSFITDLIDRAGGVSVTSSVNEAYPKFSKENALALEPEIIILSESEDNQSPNDVFKDSPAVKNGKVFKINADFLSRPGPRIVDGLAQIAKVLHPESF